jgi:ATP-binding cassette, subfamily B, bacterial
LQKAIWDLCQQVIEDSGRDGRIELRLTRNGNEAQLTISSGYGNAPPSWQLDVEELQSSLDSQGGYFSAQRDANGAAFHIGLPLRAIPDQIGALPGGAPRLIERRGSLRGVFVITIDDYAAADSLAAMVAGAGAQVLSLKSGQELLSWLQDTPTVQWPRVLVCDLALADDDGYAVMRQVRQLEGELDVPLQRRVPAIAVSGYAQSRDRMRAMMAGFQLHLAKPIKAPELIAAIHGLIDQAEVINEEDPPRAIDERHQPGVIHEPNEPQ